MERSGWREMDREKWMERGGLRKIDERDRRREMDREMEGEKWMERGRLREMDEENWMERDKWREK
jgi:hypothetical protein